MLLANTFEEGQSLYQQFKSKLAGVVSLLCARLWLWLVDGLLSGGARCAMRRSQRTESTTLTQVFV